MRRKEAGVRDRVTQKKEVIRENRKLGVVSFREGGK